MPEEMTRDRPFNMRLTEDELLMVRVLSDARGLTASDFFRTSLQRSVVFCCGSQSPSITLIFARASATAVERASVLFPTPPFWLTNVSTMGIC